MTGWWVAGWVGGWVGGWVVFVNIKDQQGRSKNCINTVMLIFRAHIQKYKYLRRKSNGHKNVINTKHTHTNTS